MTTMRTYADVHDVCKSNQSARNSSDSEGEKDPLSLLSPTPSSERRRQKRPRNALDWPSSPDGSSTTQSSDEEDAIPIPGNKLFVGEIPRTLREKNLAQIFEAFGEVKHTRVHRNKDGTSKVLIEFLAFPYFLCYRTLSLTRPHLH